MTPERTKSPADPPDGSRAATVPEGVPPELVERVYDDLRRIAARNLRDERADHTLSPTALVHEAWARLAHKSGLDVRSEAQLRALAALEVRRILVDHARRRSASKRERSALRRVTLADVALRDRADPAREIEILDVEQALRRIEERSPRMGRVVELRLFGGLTVGETATALDVSERTVVGDWTVAMARLRRDLVCDR